MKFKTIFLLFNIVILLSFGFIFVMPLIVFGLDYAFLFWGQNWYLALAFFVILGALDSYFFINWKLFRLLEREDWSGLMTFLEALLEKKKVLSLQKTKIYINACLILQKPGKIDDLRRRYLEKKPAFLPKVALNLGLPLILEGKAQEIEDYFSPFVNAGKKYADGPWMQWALAFALLLRQEFNPGKEILFALAGRKKEPVLQLLTLYLLNNLRESDPEVRRVLDPFALELKGRLTDKEWDSHIEGMKEKIILVLFMNKLIGEARTWLAGFKAQEEKAVS